jgi:MFS family permease
VPIVRAMGIQQTLQNVAMFLGPLSAGLLITLLTESITLLLASVLFFVAIVLVLRLPKQIMTHEHPMSVRQAYRDMRVAASFIRHEPFLGPMQFFGPLYACVFLPAATIVFPAWYVLNGQSSAALGLFLGIQAIGGILGGFLFATFGPKVSQRRWLYGTTAAYAGVLFGLSLMQPGSPGTFILAFCAGLTLTGIMTIPYAAFYTRTPQKLLGRVNSLGAAVGYTLSALGALTLGKLITQSSASTALLICAAFMALLAIGAATLPFMKLLDETKPS